MKSYTVVMCHTEAKPTVLRHLPYWQTPLMLFCPVDAPLHIEGAEHLFYGHRQHHGSDAIARFRYLLNHLRDRCSGYDRLIIHEYDSICVSPEFPGTASHAVTANAFYNRDTDPRFTERMYTHPPVTIPMSLLPALCEAMQQVPNDAGGSFWDRWFGQVCDVAGIEIISFCEHTHQGYSQNTIEEEHRPSALAAAQRGARVFHGVKTPEMLAAILAVSPWVLHTTSQLKKVDYVAFSLYGSAERYRVGMHRNLELIAQHYPGWSARIYMPPAMCGGAWHLEFATWVKFHPPNIPSMMARFLIHDSPDCERFLVRDADSRIGPREAAAVQAWITNGRLLHVMRDHPAHSSFPICGGMWGALGGKLLPSMNAAILAWMRNHAGAYAGHDPDQKFLADVVVPAAAGSIFQHDTFSRPYYPGSLPFPTPRDSLGGLNTTIPYFVGEVFDANEQCRPGDRALILAAEHPPEKPATP